MGFSLVDSYTSDSPCSPDLDTVSISRESDRGHVRWSLADKAIGDGWQLTMTVCQCHLCSSFFFPSIEWRRMVIASSSTHLINVYPISDCTLQLGDPTSPRHSESRRRSTTTDRISSRGVVVELFSWQMPHDDSNSGWGVSPFHSCKQLHMSRYRKVKCKLISFIVYKREKVYSDTSQYH